MAEKAGVAGFGEAGFMPGRDIDGRGALAAAQVLAGDRAGGAAGCG
ncbi:hypothetical protein RNZ50_15130 [Paracoccaceae bacterium Fryx2]|nr:hypothetical protein [Paracoccaceae bacterium Fryx2]